MLKLYELIFHHLYRGYTRANDSYGALFFAALWFSMAQSLLIFIIYTIAGNVFNFKDIIYEEKINTYSILATLSILNLIYGFYKKEKITALRYENIEKEKRDWRIIIVAFFSLLLFCFYLSINY